MAVPFNKEEDSEQLKSLCKEISYNKDTGDFYWIVKGIHRDLTKPIDQSNSRYKCLTYKQVKYALHKLAWYCVYGIYPKENIDHIDQNTHNNSIANLRLVTSFENSRNKPKRRDNQSGITGVYFEQYTQKYRASIIDKDGNNIRSKRFNTIDEAEQWRNSKINEFGYTEIHGKELSRLPYRKK